MRGVGKRNVMSESHAHHSHRSSLSSPHTALILLSLPLNDTHPPATSDPIWVKRISAQLVVGHRHPTARLTVLADTLPGMRDDVRDATMPTYMRMFSRPVGLAPCLIELASSSRQEGSQAAPEATPSAGRKSCRPPQSKVQPGQKTSLAL